MVQFSVFDGLDYSTPVSCFISFLAVNDPPFIDLNGAQLGGLDFTTLFIEDTSTSVAIVSPNLVLFDVDNITISTITITLTNLYDGTFESINTPDEDAITIAPMRNITHIQIILQPAHNNTTIEDFRLLLTNITYHNTLEEPTPGVRVIIFSVYDGVSYSIPAISYVTIVSVNDPPQLDLDSTTDGNNYNTTYIEGSGPINITSRNVLVSDNDDTIFRRITISLFSDEPITSSYEIINSTLSYIVIQNPSFNANTTTVLFQIDINLTNIRTVLQSLTYRNLLVEPIGSIRILSITLYDGTNTSIPAITNIAIRFTNTYTPSFDQSNYIFRIEENSNLSTSIGQVMAEDSDTGADGIIVYTIDSSTVPFSINSTTGFIYSTGSLDRENIDMYSFTITATDSGQPRLSSTVNVTVIILDVNEFPPIIDPTSLLFQIAENSPIHSIVGTVLASDQDASTNSMITFQIVNSHEFNINSMTGQITTNIALDRELIPSYSLLIQLSDMGSPSFISNANIIIKVTDQNDNPPEFESINIIELVNITKSMNIIGSVNITRSVNITESPNITITEGQTNIPLFQVIATDRDLNPNITYSILDTNFPIFLFIDPLTGIVYIGNTAIDRETDLEIFVIFVASDGTLYGFLYLLIPINDINDNAPIFNSTLYSANITENTLPTLPILTVLALDIDAGLNASVMYRLYTDSSLPFIIHNITGMLYLREALDYENISSYNFTIVAYDLGVPQMMSTATVIITVLDQNDNSPVFSQAVYNTSILENIMDDSIITVNAFDLDSNSNGDIVYELLNYDNIFSIHPYTGTLSNIITLDYESACNYTLSVLAKDMGTPSLNSTAIIILLVDNVEDETPVFNQSLYTIRIFENQTSSMSFYRLSAIDLDGTCPNNTTPMLNLTLPPMSMLEYNIINNTSPFSINSLTGDIYVRKVMDIDRETSIVYTYILNISVTDRALLTNYTELLIIIDDVNDNSPEFIMTLFKFTVLESLSVGSVIGTIQATDPDIVDADQLRYSILKYTEICTINETTGDIVLRQPLDYEFSDLQLAVVRVNDSLNRSDISVLVVNIEDVDDNPPIISSVTSTQDFIEGSSPLSVFKSLNIEDDDNSFQNLTRATIILTTPELYSTSSACYCNSSVCYFGVEEYLYIDASLFSGSIYYTNNNRTIDLVGSFRISTYILTLRSLQYINLISNPLPQYREITLTLIDTGNNTNNITTMITIRVHNQNAPELDLNGNTANSNEYITIFNEGGMGIPIVGPTASFIDIDTQGTNIISQVSIHLLNPINSANEVIYLVHNLALILNISILRQSNSSLLITGPTTHLDMLTVLQALRYTNTANEPSLEVRKISFIPTECRLTGSESITLVEINGTDDFAPTILPKFFSTTYIEESPEPVNISPHDVRIFDNDTLQNTNLTLSVYILDQAIDINGDLITFNSNYTIPSSLTLLNYSDVNITIYGNASLDVFENILRSLVYTYRGNEFITLSNRTILFTISEYLGPSSVSISEINLFPINDNHPYFSPNISLNYLENTTNGTILYIITVMDDDTSSKSIPEFILINNFNGTFFLTSNTGELIFTGKLDYESIRYYTLHITVIDTLSIANTSFNGTISFQVIDVNDNLPFFTNRSYTAFIGEDTPIDTPILQLMATDIDSPDNSILIFQFTQSNLEFNLNTSTGLLTTAILYDYNIQNEYNFTVSVTNPSLQPVDSALITIYIININNNPPVLSLNTSIIEFLDGSNFFRLASLNISILDTDPNPLISGANISLLTNITDYLTVDSTNTVLLVNTSLNRKRISITGRASLLDYENILSSVIYYDNTNEPLNLKRVIEFIVIDGDNKFTSATIQFTLIPVYVNDNQPVILLNGTLYNNTNTMDQFSFITVFTEESDSVSITSSNIRIHDPDIEMENLIHSAYVTLIAPSDGSDEDLIHPASNITMLQKALINTSLVLTITGQAPIFIYEQLLRSLKYNNRASKPTGLFRTIEFQVNDGLFLSDSEYTRIVLDLVNDVPVISPARAMFRYVEGQQSILIWKDINITDVDDDFLSSAQISIGEFANISFSYVDSAISISRTNNTITLKPINPIPIKAFEMTLRSGMYSISRITPYDQIETVYLIVTDASNGTSDTHITNIIFSDVDTPPSIDLNGPSVSGINFNTLFIENSVGVQITSPRLQITDLDSSNIILSLINITGIADGINEVLSTNILNSIEFSLVSRDNFIVSYQLNGTASIDSYENIIRNIFYINSRDEPTPGTRNVSFQIYNYDNMGNMISSQVAYTDLNVVQINDNPPLFTFREFTGYITEEVPVGSVVSVNISVTDADTPISQLSFNIQDRFIPFTINNITAVLTTTARINAEEISIYNITIYVRDNDISYPLFSTAQIIIRVMDINDNPPLITSAQYLNISEDFPTNVIIFNITSTDLDIDINNSQVSFSIGSSAFNNTLNLNSITGSLTLTKTLDRETVNSSNITILAINSGFNSTRFMTKSFLFITVLDVNDNTPNFSQPTMFEIFENQTIPYEIHLSVSDPDLGSNGSIIFSATQSIFFSIDSTTGIVSLISPLDFEMQTIHSLIITATDQGSPPLSSSATVTITVINVNDNAPYFINTTMSNFNITEGIYFTYTFMGRDADNDMLFYSLENADSMFVIDKRSGLLRSITTLDRESQQEYFFNVCVSDNNDSSIAFSTCIYISIFVIDINDNHPIFNQTMYSISIPEDTIIGTEIIILEATDADISSNAEINYKIDNDVMNIYFAINRITGALITNNNFDFENITQFIFSVIAFDFGNTSLTSKTTVIVNITDVNDNTPIISADIDAYTFTEDSTSLNLGGISVTDDDSFPLQGAEIILATTSCPLSQNEILIICKGNQICTDSCAELLEINSTQTNLIIYNSTQSNRLILTIIGEASPMVYEQLLQSLSYFNLQPEPIPTQRKISITVMDSLFTSNTLNLNISIELLNDNCPSIQSNLSHLTFSEGDYNLNIGSEANITVYDADFQLPASVSHVILTLSGIKNLSLEYLTVSNKSIIPFRMQSSNVSLMNDRSTKTYILLSFHNATIYTSVLRTLSYINRADEPILGIRNVTIQVYDSRINCTDKIIISIIIQNINDNPPTIQLSNDTLDYIEQSGFLNVSDQINFNIEDLDGVGSTIDSANIALINATDLTLEEITIDVEIGNITITNGFNSHFISLTGTSDIMNYVRLIASLRYRINATEPQSNIRTIVISIQDSAFPVVSRNIFVHIRLINDNPLILTSNNNSFTLTEPETVLEVGTLAGFMLSDADSDSLIRSFMIILSGRISLEEELHLNGSSVANDTFLASSLSLYEALNLLQSIRYVYNTNDSEILPGTRLIWIKLLDNDYKCTNLTLFIRVNIINNNAPIISVRSNNFSYTEEMRRSLAVGLLIKLDISDRDNTTVFPLINATIELLDNFDHPYEYISINESMLTSLGIKIINSSDSKLVLTGRASTYNYTKSLMLLVYHNTRVEPTDVPRIIRLQVGDEKFVSNIVNISIYISLKNDNPLILQCNPTVIRYVENQNPQGLLIAENLILYDGDANTVIYSAEIKLINYQNGDTVLLNNNTDPSLNVAYTDSSIYVSGQSSHLVYQALLRTLVYYLNAPEPISLIKYLQISVVNSNGTITCSINVHVIDSNDNSPLLYLNGLELTTNVAHNITYSANLLAINLAPSPIILDADFTSYIQSITVSIQSSSSVNTLETLKLQSCPEYNSNLSICHIRLNLPKFNCMCDTTTYPDLLELEYHSSSSFTISQSSPIYTHDTLAKLLSTVQLIRDGNRPSQDITTTIIKFTVTDGLFTSEPAFSTVNILFSNTAPIIDFSRIDAIIFNESYDTTISLFNNSNTNNLQNQIIFDDSNEIENLTIILKNPVHPHQENLFSESSAAYQLSYHSIFVRGPITIIEINKFLLTLKYSYDRMDSIVSRLPDLSIRYIEFEAYDREGLTSGVVSVGITFSRICSRFYSLSSTSDNLDLISDLSVPNPFKLSQFSPCHTINADLVIRQIDITNLESLSNLHIINGRLLIYSLGYLTTLKGLENLEYYKSLSLQFNGALKSTSALSSNVSNIEITTEGIIVYQNAKLQDLNGFKIVKYVNGPIIINSNKDLYDFSGLDNVVESDDIIISFNSFITFNGLNRLKLIKNNLYFMVNSEVEHMLGFSSLQTIAEDLFIYANSKLISLDGLHLLESVYNIIIRANPLLCYIGFNVTSQSYWDNIANITDVNSNYCPERNCTNANPCLNGGICFSTSNIFCNCSTGFYGDRCQFENECITNSPCQNNGTCTNNTYGYECTCLPEYTGIDCDTMIDSCFSNPCLNNGTCMGNRTEFTCNCPSGFTGKYCQTRLDTCSPGTCLNNGTCIRDDTNYHCQCNSGFTGVTCDEDIDECTYALCFNSGTCVNIEGSYNCSCLSGFDGYHCENDINECITTPCATNATCVNSNGSFYCICGKDYGGLLCDMRLDSCADQPCVNGQCYQITSNSDYMCQCDYGYTGRNCDALINSCANITCMNGGICVIQGNIAVCMCQSGYFGKLCQFRI